METDTTFTNFEEQMLISRKNFTEIIKTVWQIVGITILLFVVVEIVLTIAFKVRDSTIPTRVNELDYRSNAESYRNAEWNTDLLRETSASGKLTWEPYVYWRRAPFIGNYINVDENGLRLTTQLAAPVESDASPIQIFMFGGSTMWGSGARDRFTIPSIVSQILSEQGMYVHVVNYGELGFVSTQEVIELILQLKKGNIPDVVVFYDGVNDTFSAFHQGEAGIPQNEFNRSTEFNLISGNRYSQLRDIFVAESFSKLSIGRFANGVLRRARVLSEPRYQRLDERIATEGKSPSDLAIDVVRVYFENMEMVRQLALLYGFDSYFYWQPTIFNKSDLTEYESEVLNVGQGHSAFFDSTYSRVSRKISSKDNDSPYVDLSNLFLNVKEPIFLDWMHLSEQGNMFIANRMGNDVYLGLMQTGIE